MKFFKNISFEEKVELGLIVMLAIVVIYYLFK